MRRRALAATVSNATLSTPSDLAALSALANSPTNDTSVVSCPIGSTCPLAIETLVSRAILPTGHADADAHAVAARYLSHDARSLVDEWEALHIRLRTCFIVGASFFAGGCLSSVVLLLMYITRKVHANSFQTKLMARSSLTTSCSPCRQPP